MSIDIIIITMYKVCGNGLIGATESLYKLAKVSIMEFLEVSLLHKLQSKSSNLLKIFSWHCKYHSGSQSNITSTYHRTLV